jgi:hypothetical protein
MAGNSILFIVPYFGKWPMWFPAYLRSCGANPSVDWLFITDIEPPPKSPANVRFLRTTLTAVKDLASERLGFDIQLKRGYKLCDLRPAYGHVFAEHVAGYTFWGHCDVDMVWGNIRQFIDDALLSESDVFSARMGRIAGHCTLFRNTEPVNALYRIGIKRYQAALEQPNYLHYEERAFSKVVSRAAADGKIRVSWSRHMVNFARPPDVEPSRLSWGQRYTWREGRLFNSSEADAEVLYVHFMTWKATMQACFVGYEDEPAVFSVTYSQISVPGKGLPLAARWRARSITFKHRRILYYLIGWRRALTHWGAGLRRSDRQL